MDGGPLETEQSNLNINVARKNIFYRLPVSTLVIFHHFTRNAMGVVPQETEQGSLNIRVAGDKTLQKINKTHQPTSDIPNGLRG